jgi:hypothetical protein
MMRMQAEQQERMVRLQAELRQTAPQPQPQPQPTLSEDDTDYTKMEKNVASLRNLLHMGMIDQTGFETGMRRLREKYKLVQDAE